MLYINVYIIYVCVKYIKFQYCVALNCLQSENNRRMSLLPYKGFVRIKWNNSNRIIVKIIHIKDINPEEILW